MNFEERRPLVGRLLYRQFFITVVNKTMKRTNTIPKRYIIGALIAAGVLAFISLVPVTHADSLLRFGKHREAKPTATSTVHGVKDHGTISVLTGKVTATTSSSVTVTYGRATTTLVLGTDGEVKIAGKKGAFSDVEVGDVVMARGSYSKITNVFAADRIHVYHGKTHGKHGHGGLFKGLLKGFLHIGL